LVAGSGECGDPEVGGTVGDCGEVLLRGGRSTASWICSR